MTLDTSLIIYIAVLSFILGAVLGSFLNCVCIRLVNHENYTKGKSHCMTCGHDLGPLDLIPIFSWLCHKGKCKYCGDKISPRYFITEIVMAAAFTLTWLICGLSIYTPVYMIIECLMLCAALCDYDTQEIPDRFFICIAILWAVYYGVNVLTSGAWHTDILIKAAIGGIGVPLVIVLLSLIMDKLLKKETIGGGDIKLLFAVGLFLGFEQILNIIIMCIIGLIFAFATGSSKKSIPLVPSMAISTTITLLFGQRLIDLYYNIIF